jgi:hypothetical protein
VEEVLSQLELTLEQIAVSELEDSIAVRLMGRVNVAAKLCVRSTGESPLQAEK